MKTSHLLMSVSLLSSALLGCGSATNANPKELWIALNGSERAIQLVPLQPAPF